VGYDISPLKRVKFKILTTSRQADRFDNMQGKARHFNPLEDYRFFHHWFSGVKTP
jgi:hypothetical protein